MKTDYFALDSYWPLTSKMTLLSLCCSYDCYSERIILTLIVRPIFLFLRGRRQRSDEDILEIFDVGYLKISQEDNGWSFILIWTLNCLLVSLINDLKILKLELTLVDFDLLNTFGYLCEQLMLWRWSSWEETSGTKSIQMREICDERCFEINLIHTFRHYQEVANDVASWSWCIVIICCDHL